MQYLAHGKFIGCLSEMQMLWCRLVYLAATCPSHAPLKKAREHVTHSGRFPPKTGNGKIGAYAFLCSGRGR